MGCVLFLCSFLFCGWKRLQNKGSNNEEPGTPADPPPPSTPADPRPPLVALTDSGAEGDTWPVAEFGGEGYLALPKPESALDAFTLEVWFLSRALHGMLLYGGQGPTVRGHFVSLNLASGFLHFRFDVGSGVVNLT